MLVLGRKENESVMIGDHIKITIANIGSKIVRLGIEAPKDISVYRTEIYEKLNSLNLIDHSESCVDSDDS